MERPGTVWLFLVLCAPALVSGGNHAFEVLRTANQHFQGFDFFAIEARLPSDGLSSSENWCRDYQNLCAEYGLRPTGCGEQHAVNGGGGSYDYARCVTEYNSDPYINDVLSCSPAHRVAAVAHLAFSAGRATLGRSFGFYRCDTSNCQRGIVESHYGLSYTTDAFPGDRIVYTVCTGSATACTSSPCMNAGTCQDQGYGYNCTCATGYTGNNCDDIDECVSSPCMNGGRCIDGVNSYTCQCPAGMAGDNCQINIDECVSSPCMNGGRCIDGVTSYTCQCPAGTAGDNCQINVDECASNPCSNGGTCVDKLNGYSCACPKDVAGENCETVLDMGACYQFSLHAVSYDDASQSCGAGGGFLADVRKAEQQHLIGNASTTGSDVSLWIGIKVPPVTLTYSDGSSVSDELEWASSQPASPCDLCVLLDSSSNYQAITTPCGEQHNYVCQAEPKPCGQDICHNGGNCSSCFDGSYNFCACLDGFDGKFCEINIDECASSPCQNGGSCTDGVDSFSCDCTIGYSGDFCEADIDWCTQGQGYCPFGWICEDQVTHFICHATSNNLKSLYQCDSDTCPNGMTCIAEGPGSFSCRAG